MHHFVNFKNFADAQINLLNPVTLLIGRNGAGKSNVIEAVELLAYLAQGHSVHQISDVGRGSGTTFEIRGGFRSCPRREHLAYHPDDELFGPQTFTLAFDARVDQQPMRYSIEVDVSGKPHIANESLKWGGRVLFETVADAATADADILSVRHDNFARGKNKPTRAMTADQSVLSRYESLSTSDNDTAQKAMTVVRGVRSHLQHAYVFDPNPRLMRNYENVGQTQLFRDGSNLASVLFELERSAVKLEKEPPSNPSSFEPIQGSPRTTLKLIRDRIRQLPEDAFTELTFEQTRLGEVGLGFRYSDTSVLGARQMSDGTLRALAILTALETVPQGSRLVVEEIDNGIHPARVKTLVDAVWETARRRRLNVLATTHNPATLDQLDAEQIQGVVLCFHDGSQNASRLLPVPELPAAESLLEQGRLGELMTQQVLERHVQPDFAKKRTEKGLAWLKKLKHAPSETSR